MSYQLVAEVLDHAPPMTAAERLVLVAIAERARTATRECDLDTATLERRTGGLDPSNVRAALRRLAGRGIEVRVSLGTDRTGRPVYAFRGQVPRYRLPSLPVPPGCRCDTCRNQPIQAVDNFPPAEPEGEHQRPPSDITAGHEGGRERPPTSEGGRRTTEGGRSDTEGGRSTTHGVAQHPPYPSGTGPVINQRPPTTAHLIARTGATEDETHLLIQTIKTRFRPRSFGAYVRAMSDDDLTDLLAEIRAAAHTAVQLPPKCDRCDPSRLVELPDGRLSRCPTCHPIARARTA
ncbi:hypothetical protein O7627_24285 [Solwaraspora sp. WMMD1047]|uniref:hypothetical protein n=1 Tax=Solwaraspora sp. WMMD1047 TaxID=3016102 RepID=UPI00241795E1|nr:hypothetical protein [Solwaraspora sp. WMMD1047]MDG4832402.1 hypothetical protein [Solwaraspora sp. WMMD1047]